MNNATCSRCDGKGKLWFWAHRANGVCYACGGSGVVACDPVTAKQALVSETCWSIEVLSNATDAVLTRNTTWAETWVTRAAEGLMSIQDTDMARGLLTKLSPGIRSAVVAKGWELKNAAHKK